jgi:hypothetical protein
VFGRPNPVNGRNWHNTSYDPLWAALERLGGPLRWHEGGRRHSPPPGATFDPHMRSHTCPQPLARMGAVVDIVGGGVLECCPGLPGADLVGTCSWAPGLLWRLDEPARRAAA